MGARFINIYIKHSKSVRVDYKSFRKESQALKCQQTPQMIEPEFDAILGHSSAHSLATGPVTADPFISPFGLTITPALSRYVLTFKSKTYLRSIDSILPFFYKPYVV